MELDEPLSPDVGSPSAAAKTNNRTTKHPFKYACPFCPSKRYTSRSGLLSHKNTVHFQRKPYRCQICNAHFFTSASRVGHIRKEHPTKIGALNRKPGGEDDGDDEEEDDDVTFVVDDSEMEVVEQAKRRKTVSPTEDIDCSSEGESSTVIEHKRNDSKQPAERRIEIVSHDHAFLEKKAWQHKEQRDAYVCLECNLSFCGADKLLLHLEKHALPRQETRRSIPTPTEPVAVNEWQKTVLSCDHCSRSFCHPTWKKYHMKYHHPEAYGDGTADCASHKCESCFESFQSSNQKRLHEALSCPLSMLTCSKCPAKFGSVASYAAHAKERHCNKTSSSSAAETSSFRCPVCPSGDNFEYDERFLKHFKEMHESTVVTFNCNYCNHSSDNPKVYLEHLRSHPGAAGSRITLYAE